jgi:outer membrane receptor for ferrienterochelin and colicins
MNRFTTTALLLAACIAASAAARAEEDEEDVDSVIVTATRQHGLVRDQPIRVEVVPEEEIEENLAVAPGDLTNLLNELAGARMEPSGGGLGGTALELRGLPGRHARILSDGLQLAGAQTDSFSLLQTAPLDLARVEVIKGVASALYGGSALAGVLNLVTRRPGAESEALLNQTSRGGTDLVGFYASDPGAAAFTLIGSANYQERQDRDADGWSELPGFRRVMLRPRAFWQAGGGEVFATVGLMGEKREGGTTSGRTTPGGTPFPESLDTQRFDAGVDYATPTAAGRTLRLNATAGITDRDRVHGPSIESDRQSAANVELTLAGSQASHAWVVGSNVAYDRLHTDDVARVSYDRVTPALFAQDEFAPRDWVRIAASARIDSNDDVGTFFSPRIAALFKLAPEWSLRASAGTGFSPPTPLIEEVESRSLALVDVPSRLRAEQASSVSLDTRWADKPWEVNVSVFSSRIRHPLGVRQAPTAGRLELINEQRELRSDGAELLAGYSSEWLHVLANATWLDVTEDGATGREAADRLPRVTAEIAVIAEEEELGRVGVEISYTGTQHLDQNPFATRSPSFVTVNALAEWHLRRIRLFVNALNIGDVRQQDYQPMLRPTPGLGGDPVTAAWTSLVGRTFNVGVRAEL